MNVVLAVTQTSPKDYTLHLSDIVWWHYVVVLAIVFLVMGLKNSKHLSSLGVMVGVAVAYILVVTYLLPFLNVHSG